ncbi:MULTISPECIES: M20/M25/M40 family metallo-hydrolase [Lachnospiraceae]|uniref:M20/M25/M40 family metallo-hydrolase n=1 Tax=Lachnospiraceae TaxID=186803 RepID=UPI0005526808|nr:MULTISPECIES: M20/M25/M40 family metallo-hydrolase [Lachnospiraceae]SDB65183.1 peptidase T-like protein [Butyrivibrio sp. INlla16]SEM70252.1 peptidase T-like protein [Butyrivibrio sp. ob235]SFG67748.1 tripeptide aminopeptidase [Oribacterium sp. WCC10]
MKQNDKRVIDRFIELALVDGESFNERMVADYLVAEFQKLGIKLCEDDTAGKIGGNCGNLYGFAEGRGKYADSEPILFCAHMDTVAPGNNKKIILNDDGTITSDHTTVLGADDRVGIAGIIEAYTEVLEEELDHPPIEFLFTVAEEVYGLGSAALDYSKIRSRIAFAPDCSGEYGVYSSCEPTLISFEVHIKGKASHAGYEPEKGINAIAVAAAAISRIKQGWADDHTTLNIGTIEGGSVTNAVPENCLIKGEIRSGVHEDAYQTMEYVESVFSEEAKSAGAELCIDKKERITVYRKDPEARAGSALDRYKRALGKQGRETLAKKSYGGSDINSLIKHGMDGLNIYGPMYNIHTTEEYTTVQEIVSFAELLKILMVLDWTE